MITAIILIGLMALGIFLAEKYMDDYHSMGLDILGIMLSIGTFVLLILHIIGVSTAKYGYNIKVHEREAIQTTLNNSRLNSNVFENATITKKVMDWNINLSSLKYDNTTLFFDQYIDDRIETIEPIK